MTVINNGNHNFDHRGENGRGSFEEHAERMGMFRRSHAPVLQLNAPRRDEPVVLESKRLLKVIYTMRETGGSAGLAIPAEWSALVPMWRIAPRRFSPN